MGFCLGMNDRTKLEQIRDLVESKVLELQPFAGEEMNLLQTDPRRDGFVNGERTLAMQILGVLDEDETKMDPVEEEMVMAR